MNSIPCIKLRLAGKGLAIALALFVCMGTAVSGAVAVSCENGGPCLNCMPAMHVTDKPMAGHMPVSRGCSSNMPDSACSLDNFASALHRQIAMSDTVFPASEFPLALSILKVEPESAAARHFGLPLHPRPPGPTVPIYLKTLSILC
jgi:hypothetical protein